MWRIEQGSPAGKENVGERRNGVLALWCPRVSARESFSSSAHRSPEQQTDKAHGSLPRELLLRGATCGGARKYAICSVLTAGHLADSRLGGVY